MGPLWAEILDVILPIVDPNKHSRGPGAKQETVKEQNKLLLISGHDGTVAPLMMSLDPDLWDDLAHVPYASMLVMEVSC